jgi:hypothetical protein
MVCCKKPGHPEGSSVAEVSRRIEGLPTEQLRKVREYEKNNKNRETLIEQIDCKIRANNSYSERFRENADRGPGYGSPGPFLALHIPS